MEHDVPHVCIPAGTRNHFALDLGLDRDDVVGALDAFTDAGDGRDERLRAVASGHPDRVHPFVDRSLSQLEQVVPWLEHHRLHAATACLAWEVEALGFAAARFGVDQQDRSLRLV
jgi:hypothetical protein